MHIYHKEIPKLIDRAHFHGETDCPVVVVYYELIIYPFFFLKRDSVKQKEKKPF